MSKSITLTCLFILIRFHCAIENKNDSNELTTECLHDCKSDDQKVSTKSLATEPLKDNTRPNDGEYRPEKGNQDTKYIAYINADEKDDEPAETLSSNPTAPSLRVTPKATAQPAGLGTDVIFRLQEKLRNLANPMNDKYIPVPEAWPVITLKIPRLSLPPHITPPLRTTRSFLDHFKTVKFSFRQTWNTNPKFYRNSNVSKSNDVTVRTPDEQFRSFVWTHSFVTSPMHDHRRSAMYPKAPLFNVMRKGTENWWENNPHFWMDTLDLKWLTRTTAITPNINVTVYLANTTFEPHLLGYTVTEHEFVKKRKANTILSATTVTTTTTPTTTTTTRTTRTYPYPNWICYECGRNETKYGSSLCHDVFESYDSPQSYRKHKMHYKCNGHSSVVHQCFKRFLDIGDYNERGCRDWPPRKSGRTFVSKRLRALEKVLKGVKDGCIFSPQAALVPFSHTVQLYARFHVCVCKGKLCNTAGSIGSSKAVIFVMIVAFCIYKYTYEDY